MASKLKSMLRPHSLGRQLNFTAGASTTMCNAMLDEFGLTLPQWVVLSALWQKNNLTVGEISRYNGTNIPATSRILDRMIEKNLLRRDNDKTDRRAVRLTLSNSGEELRHLSNFHERVNRILLSQISQQEADVFTELLQKIERNARDWKSV